MDCTCCLRKENIKHQSPIALSTNNNNILISENFNCLKYENNIQQIDYYFDKEANKYNTMISVLHCAGRGILRVRSNMEDQKLVI